MAGVVIMCGVGLMWGLPNHWDFAQDSVVPLGRLALINAPADEVTQYRYPPFHLKLLTGLFRPLRRIIESSPIHENDKLSATLFILSGRVVSLAMAAGAVWLVMRTGARLWNEHTGMAAAMTFTLAPVTLYYAKNANLDMPYVFWLAWAFFFYVRILQENRARDYLWLGLLTALSTCTKDQGYAFFVLMPIPLILHLRRPAPGERPPPARAAWTRIGLGLAGFLVPFVLIHTFLYDHHQGFWIHLKTVTGVASVGWREFTRGPAGQLRLLIATLLRLMDAWTPAGLFLAGVGLWLELRNRKPGRLTWAVFLPVISYYLFFPAVIGYVYTRFLLPVVLVLALFAGRAVVWLWQAAGRRAPARAAALALVGWVALAGVSVNLVMSRYSRYNAQVWMEKNLSAQTRISYLGDMRDMPRFNKPLNAVPLAGDTAKALVAARPDVVVLSLQQGQTPAASPCMRLSSIARRRLRHLAFGRALEAGARRSRSTAMEDLLRGDLGYVIAERFESPIAPFVPEVAESLNRTIVIMKRESKP